MVQYMFPWRPAAALTLLGGLLPGPAGGQQPFEPIPPAAARQYHLSFARNFFASPSAEKADRSRYEALMKSLEQLKGKVAASPQNLLQTLELNDEAQAELMRHAIYLYLRSATNRKDTESHAKE